MRESKIEQYLRREVERRGGRCLKFVSPGRRGVPDRIVQWPERLWDPVSAGLVRLARTHYVETKRPGGRLSPHQRREHAWLHRHGFPVLVLDTITKVDNYIRRHA